MADPIDPIPSAAAPPPPPPPPLPTDADAKSGTTGLPSNVAAALACIPLVGGLIFYLLEKRDAFRSLLRHAVDYLRARLVFVQHRFQDRVHDFLVDSRDRRSARLFAGPSFRRSCSSAFLVVMIVAIMKAFSGVRWEIPYIGPIARKQTGETTI